MLYVKYILIMCERYILTYTNYIYSSCAHIWKKIIAHSIYLRGRSKGHFKFILHQYLYFLNALQSMIIFYNEKKMF